MSARTAILQRLRAQLADAPGRDPAAPARRLAAAARNLVPARAQGEAATLAQRFVEQATAAHATVERVADFAAVPQAVAAYLSRRNLPARLKRAPAPQLAAMPWQATALEVTAGRAAPEDAVSLTLAFAGIAETGTLLLRSSAESPTTLSFLPDDNLVVLPLSRLVGGYEDAFDLLRREEGALPRSVNLITGPSRTGDIEQKMELGAHGPRRLHVILVEDDAQA